MNHKTTYTSALIALGLISAASTQAAVIPVNITGSTAFRGNFFSAATAVGGIFAGGGTVVTGSGSSGTLVVTGFIGAQEYALCCVYSGSEAGIANVAGRPTLPNPGLAGSPFNNGLHNQSGTPGPLSGSVLPGVSTIFPTAGGHAGATASIADLTLADTSQAVSLTPPSTPATTLHDFGTVGCVTFTLVKGKNSVPDASWTHLTDVASYQMLFALGSTVPASYLTGVSTDTDDILVVGRNAGSGTRANMITSVAENPVLFPVAQQAFNSFYTGAGVLTYNIVKTAGGAEYTHGTVTTANDAADSAASYPTLVACFANTITSSGNVLTPALPDAVAVSDDGYDSGAFVSDCLSLDGKNAIDQNMNNCVVIGYAGISDANHAKTGVAYAATETAPSQPGGAVWLSLNGIPYSDTAVVIGTYPFWGHEHLLGAHTPTAAALALAHPIFTALNSGDVGVTHINIAGEGDGTAGPSSAIQGAAMAADKPSGGDTGYPSPGAWTIAYVP